MTNQERIVFVKSHSHLLSATGHDCRYRTAAEHAPLPGYWYVVSWPEDVSEPLFDTHAHYAGPFDSAAAAEHALAHRPDRPVAFDADRAAAGTEVPFVADWSFGSPRA